MKKFLHGVDGHQHILGVPLTPVCSILAARVINSGTERILLTHAGFHPTSQLAEDAIVPSTSFPSGVPPVALAPVHKTPNLRFLHRHPGTPTLTSRGSSRVSAQDSPPLASNSKPGIRVAFISIHVSSSSLPHTQVRSAPGYETS